MRPATLDGTRVGIRLLHRRAIVTHRSDAPAADGAARSPRSRHGDAARRAG
jgi:hypothetical protein